MKTYSLTDCQHMLAITNRQLDRLLAIAGIDKQQLAIASTNRRMKLITEEQLTLIQGLIAIGKLKDAPPEAPHRAIVEADDPRIDGLLQRIDQQDTVIRTQTEAIKELERRLAALEARQWSRPSQTTDYTATPHTSHAKPSVARRISQPHGDRSTGDTLPALWMSINEFSKRFGTPVTTLEKARLRGKFAYHVAPDEDHLWKRGQAKILYALDPDEQAALLVLYPPRPGYEEGPASPAGPESEND